METTSPYRPRVSRETRLLLAAGVMAVAALWLLARFRFPERPVTPNPVPAVLSQLASGPKFDDLAGEIVQLQARLQPSLVGLDSRPGVRDSSRTRALRLRDDLAVTWIPLEPSREPSLDASILARDAASGLAVVRVPASVPAPRPVVWTLRQSQQSRFLFASDASPEGVSLRPVFIGAIEPVASPLWPEPLWIVPARTDVDAGAFLFASSGELAGLVIRHGEGVAIMPGETVISAAERLLATPRAPAGAIGLDVQKLTPALAAATGASVGVVVTWVDQQGAGRDQVRAGDVVEALDGRPLTTSQLWDVRLARLRAGESIGLRVRRRGEVREVTLVATAAAAMAAPGSRSLGLTLRGRSRIGAEVIRVEPESAADFAGLTAGDVITLVGDVVAPAPEQVVRSYTSSDPGARLIVAVTRGEAHFVTTLER